MSSPLPTTSPDTALALKANARAGLPTPDMRGWTEFSWSNEGIEYGRCGDRLFLPPSEKRGEWREVLSPRQPIPLTEEEEEGAWRELPPPQPKRRQRKPRRPTLASVSRQASKAGIEVARYEIKPDGTVVVVTGKSEATEPNPWLDDLKVTKQ